MDNYFKIVVPSKPEYISTVRLAVSSIANTAGFDIEAVEDIKVAVSEACTNIVQHGNADNKDGKHIEYEVTCEFSDDKFNISVEDEGSGYDMKKYKVPELPSEAEGGLGLFIIRALMDEVEVESQLGIGTHIKMVKYIQEI